jgi:drug/metabolite transporter (DMT)-like permease
LTIFAAFLKNVSLTENRSLIVLNLSMLFMSTSGVLGRYITMDSTLTTLFRCLIASSIILLFIRWRKLSLVLKTKRDWGLIVASTLFLTGHWITYFYSLDLSNVALAILTLYTFPAITAVLEPLLTGVPFRLINLGLAFMVLLGVYVMMPAFDIEHVHTKAIILGLLSATLYSVRNIIVKGPSTRYDGSVLMFHQLWMMALVLMPALLFIETGPIVPQLGGLLLLGFVTTALGHSLFLISLKYLPVIKASLIACVVPVYGVMWAYLALGEVPSTATLMGGSIILITVVLATLTKNKVV